jgi:hypothetical protein
MIHRKQMVEFADFLIRFKDIMKSNIEKTTKEIDIKLADISERNGWVNVNSRSLDIDEVLEEQHKKLYAEVCAEIMLILDKNSLRFNHYRFKNYILARTKKTDTNSVVNH